MTQKKHLHKTSMDDLLGLLRIHIHRGINLAIRDLRSSDPYLILQMGKQKLRTRVVKKNINPEWDEDLTLSISDPNLPVKIAVFDKDTFTFDDKMGDTEFDIKPFVEAAQMRLQGTPSGTVIKRIKPTRQNCLSEESCIVWANGKLVQNMFLRLRNVECGEVELQLQWIDISGSRDSQK
ncbi:Protein C2-DOMAIN ABA-RELATED like [Actinidia chinensis var. chinensis]|uniref:Protein C2-DOMAIN ABA-RELATED like n=1 Tax=Actinidia chinensis var. chinensis TaxID=1590841 RepID=A0A2R6S124_ACTCC|nr:Protein C2-DOMAIN ABA-RELATED like [Actinidia chinensis var. chinensis]